MNKIDKNIKLEIKKAEIGDTDTILFFIKELAKYEKLSHEMQANEELIKNSLFKKNPKAESLIGYYCDKPVCFALYFFNYSTFLGKIGLYLEDLFVLPEFRGKGFGKQMLIRLAGIAKSNNCGRFEWSVLDWNESAINFYENLGAKAMKGWTVYRLDEAGINSLSNLQ